MRIDDHDVPFYESYACDSESNYENYCNKDMERQVEEQSATLDPEARRRLVREIDLQIQQDIGRPMLYHSTGGTCWHPHVRGITIGVNSIYSHWRMEDAWLAPR